MVEAAFTLTLLLALVFGTVDFARGVWIYNLVSHSAREATRYAIVHGRNSKYPATSDSVKDVVKKNLVGLKWSSASVTVTWLPDNIPGSAVNVAVSYPFSFLGAFVPQSTLTVKSTSQVTITN